MWVGGQELGYAPIEKAKLLPGVHAIEWESAKIHNKKILTFKPGEWRVIEDKDM